METGKHIFTVPGSQILGFLIFPKQTQGYVSG
jgi:hypothetical protein